MDTIRVNEYTSNQNKNHVQLHCTKNFRGATKEASGTLGSTKFVLEPAAAVAGPEYVHHITGTLARTLENTGRDAARDQFVNADAQAAQHASPIGKGNDRKDKKRTKEKSTGAAAEDESFVIVDSVAGPAGHDDDHRDDDANEWVIVSRPSIDEDLAFIGGWTCN